MGKRHKRGGPHIWKKGETTFVKHCTNKSVSCYPHSFLNVLYVRYTFKRFCFLKKYISFECFFSFSWISTVAYVCNIFVPNPTLKRRRKCPDFEIRYVVWASPPCCILYTGFDARPYNVCYTLDWISPPFPSSRKRCKKREGLWRRRRRRRRRVSHRRRIINFLSSHRYS